MYSHHYSQLQNIKYISHFLSIYKVSNIRINNKSTFCIKLFKIAQFSNNFLLSHYSLIRRRYNDKKEFTKPFQCQEKRTNKNCITIDDSFPCLTNYPRRCSTRVLLDTIRHKDPHSRYPGSMNIYLLYGSDRYLHSLFLFLLLVPRYSLDARATR